MDQDKYEQIFLEKVKAAAKTMVVDRMELGELRLKRFAAMVYHFISREEKLDLITSGGNSGVATTAIAQLVYEKTGLIPPPIVVLPVIRPSNKDGIKIDTSYLQLRLKGIKNISRILFVDDEIMRGQTAKICFEAIWGQLKNETEKTRLSCTIIAENHFFVWRYDLEGIAVRFLPFAMVLQGYNGNFGYLIPSDLLNGIQEALKQDVPDRNEALAILLGNKRKVLSGKTAVFQNDMGVIMSEYIENYANKREVFISRIEELVEQGIQEYRDKEITFKYLV
jgi:hypothetical protein